MKKKLKEVLKTLLAITGENKYETQIEISNDDIRCTTETMGYGGFFFYLSLIFLPSGYLAASADNWIEWSLSIIWFIVFFYHLYEEVKNEVSLFVNMSEKILRVHSNNLLQKKYNLLGKLSKKWAENSVPFDNIKEITLKSDYRHRYSPPITQIYAITNENKKILLTEFKEAFAANRFTFVLREIVAGRHL